MKSEQVGYKFKVDTADEIPLTVPNGVFVPTGTTKCLIEAVRGYVHKPGKMLDLGCGCGIIGVALHQNGLARLPLYASDLSEQAVDCAKKNTALYHCPAVAKCGPLFDPWRNEKFDYIVDDVSGVAEKVAKISPWYNSNIPCQSGEDGTSLIVEVLRKAPAYLNPGGLFFFPIVSFSNANKILTVARENFSHVERLTHKEWPLPKEMQQHISLLKRLQEKGHIQIVEKYGMVLWFTDIYVAFNPPKPIPFKIKKTRKSMIILTGASGGIGKEILPDLLKIGNVIGIYNTTVPTTPPDNRLTYEQINLEEPAQIKSFAEKWGPKLSRIALVHLAATKIDGLATNYEESDWDRVMRVNLRGSFLITKALLPYMIQNRWGRIIHISSLGGIQGFPGTVAYSTSKTGLIGMSRVFAKEYARFNITSNVLVLGYFEKGLFTRLQDDVKKKIMNQIPSKTLGKISNIANAIEFLIKSEYVNGSTINIDGGA